MYQAGIQNVVSSSGTSLTKEQIKLIRRYTQNISILYDGDSAGIKASFRGIDLILEEGMNVKVVLFPDGEDPDSYSKKVSTNELEEYIKEHTQDFISFKADILLKDGESDPIKRAELIREIVHSVALIPDQITRTVYLQQIAQRFDISEQIISNELIKLRKNVVSKQIQEPEIMDLPVERQIEPATKPEPAKIKESSQYNEFNLLRIMIRYGTRAVQIEQVDAEGKKSIAETSVIELIHHELDKDELGFTHPLYSKIYHLLVEGLMNNELYSANYLKRLEDQEIVSFVSDIESNDHELSSKWLSNYNITTRTEGDRINEATMNAIYSFKGAKIEEKIREIREKLADTDNLTDEMLMDLLAEQMAYEKVKILFADKLGRIILR
jgi:DNA primase